MKLIENTTLLGIATLLILRIWQQLELSMYGEVQVRDVDTIITIFWLFLLIIAYLKGYIDGHETNKKKEDEKP